MMNQTKNCTCYCFNDIIKIVDFNLDNILIDQNSYDTKLWLMLNPCVLGSIKYMDLLEFMMELDI